MKLIKSIMSAFAIVLATTACAGNGGENKKSNEPTKEDNKMEVVSLNKAEFLKKVYDFEANPNDWKFEGKRPAIVDFYATWCGPCKALHPVLEELSKEYSGKVDIYQIDVDQEKELAGIRSIPTLLLIPMKEEPRITQGALPKDQLKKAIDEFLLKQNNEAK
jgi:thioredoxin 1